MNRYSRFRFDAKSYWIHHYIKEEKAIIPIEIKKMEDLFCSYSKNKIALNSELITYIEDITYYIPYEYSIVFEIHGICANDDEKAFITSSIKDYFGVLSYDKQVELHYNTKKALTLFITGFLILCSSFLMNGVSGMQFLKEILSIIGTFAIWEFVDTIWFERKSKQVDVWNAGQIATATIDFIETEK